MKRKFTAILFCLLVVNITLSAHAQRSSTGQFANFVASGLKLPGKATITYSGVKSVSDSIVVLNNDAQILPIMQLDNKSMATVHVNNKSSSIFDSIANKYWSVRSINGTTIKSDSGFAILHDELKLFNHVIVYMSGPAVHDSLWLTFLDALAKQKQLILVVSDDQHRLINMEFMSCPVVWVPSNSNAAASVTAQLMFGGVAINNRLPVTYSRKWKKGKGDKIQKTRLGYSDPVSAGFSETFMDSVDALVNSGISSHASPAVVILMVKDGSVFFNKAYGNHTYAGNQQTKVDDIFDLASVTKIAATTPALMRLYDRKLIHPDSAISQYVHALRAFEDKKNIRIKEALLHEAGFTPYIKFYESLKPLDLSFLASPQYPTAIAAGYHLKANYFKDSMWPITLRSPVLTRGQYVYSDVSMYMMKEVVENVSGQTLDRFVDKELYAPLGLQTTGYLPLKRFDAWRIVPTTENDNWLRNMHVRGFVNDPGAAMAGGVQGHAGLFSNANDLAIYFQLLLNKGSYGGTRLFDPATVELFTSRQSAITTRGFGFIKADPSIDGFNKMASPAAFGHSGYTGTYVWADPAYGIVYICLTNRVYPDDGKTYGTSKINIRSGVLTLFYEAIINSRKSLNL
jgi:CubicO group peptidase (beta-lactamase class C family)